MSADSGGMSGEALVRRVVDAINRSDAPGYAALFAPDAVMYDPFFPEPLKGREAIEATTKAVLRAFPDLQWRLRSVTDGGDRVAFDMTVSGVNDGPLEMPDGELSPTGRTMSVDMGIFLQLSPDGLITEERSYFDVTGLAAQLGLGP